jgi:hypothetical protein
MNAVIPGRAEGAGPESILRSVGDYGFRARRCAAPRNDEERESPHDSRGREIATASPYQRQAENG